MRICIRRVHWGRTWRFELRFQAWGQARADRPFAAHAGIALFCETNAVTSKTGSSGSPSKMIPMSKTARPLGRNAFARSRRRRRAKGRHLQLQGMSSLLTAAASPVTIQVFYAADKTTDSGREVVAPVLKHTVSLNTDQTTQLIVDLTDPAFAGNYGAIFLNSIGSDPLDIFQTYVQSPLTPAAWRSFAKGTRSLRRLARRGRRRR